MAMSDTEKLGLDAARPSPAPPASEEGSLAPWAAEGEATSEVRAAGPEAEAPPHAARARDRHRADERQTWVARTDILDNSFLGEIFNGACPPPPEGAADATPPDKAAENP
jgi:hypothetical protein